MEICCALLCYCKEQIVSPYLVCRVFFLSYCRVYTLQYKVPWGNYCWDLALKSNWTELNWIERQQFDFIYQKSKAPKLLCIHLGMLQTAWQQSGTDCLWQHSERCEINTYLKQEKKTYQNDGWACSSSGFSRYIWIWTSLNERLWPIKRGNDLSEACWGEKCQSENGRKYVSDKEKAAPGILEPQWVKIGHWARRQETSRARPLVGISSGEER